MREEEYKKKIQEIEKNYFKRKKLSPNFNDKTLQEYGERKFRHLKESGKYDEKLLRLAKEMLG